jgi:hypothetical protein
MVDKEFKLYDEAPGFWLYIALSLAADVSENPLLSAKSPYSKLERYKYDLYTTFKEAAESYNKRSKRGKYIG